MASRRYEFFGGPRDGELIELPESMCGEFRLPRKTWTPYPLHETVPVASMPPITYYRYAILWNRHQLRYLGIGE